MRSPRFALRVSVVRRSGWRAARVSAAARAKARTGSNSSSGASGTTTWKPREPVVIRNGLEPELARAGRAVQRTARRSRAEVLGAVRRVEVEDHPVRAVQVVDRG